MTRTSARHPAQELFEATGEKVQIFARDTRQPADAPLARLDRGMAPAWRPDARAGHLVCPVSGCEDPRVTTRAGSKRDHFAHLNLVGAPHAPETYFHHVGKHVVGSWAREHYPEARVVVDAEATENRQVPDVLVEFPDGRRFAFEVQCAALTEDAWRHRHDGYAKQGIVDVWLLGHLPPHLRPGRGASAGRYALTPLIEALDLAGVPVRWINPDERAIATPLLYADPEARYAERWNARGALLPPRLLSIGIDPLDQCSIEGNRFVTPADRLDRGAAERWLALERERMAAILERAQRERVACAAAEAERVRRKDWIDRKKEERALDYARRVQPRVRAELGEAIHVIEVEADSDDQIWIHPSTWHARLFQECIEGRVGSTFTVAQACAPFMDAGRPGGPSAAVRAFLFFLARRGYIEFSSRGPWIEGDVTVLADSRCPPEDAPHEWRT